MVSIQQQGKQESKISAFARFLPFGVMFLLIILLWPFLTNDHYYERSSSLQHVDASTVIGKGKKSSSNSNNNNNLPQSSENSSASEKQNQQQLQCPYKSIDDLTEEERHPVKGKRHMVTPPKGGPLSLVCCQTTKGPFNVLVHEAWAPLGAQQFKNMVRTDYFSSVVPLMRCVKGFICQFGLPGDPKLNKLWRAGIPDDPNWLPEGPTHRKNEDGVFRFASGYFAYAGGGKNSRGNQFIVSLAANQRLAGGSPWEVPWGELVGKHSFDTFSKVYTGYGEKGPPQGKLANHGVTEELKKEYPLLDYVTACGILDERVE